MSEIGPPDQSPTRLARLQQRIAHPPQHRTWTVVRNDTSIELRDQADEVWATQKPPDWFRGPDGHQLVCVYPSVRRRLSLKVLLQLALSTGDGTTMGGPMEKQILNVKCVSTLLIAEVFPQKNQARKVVLLPKGPLTNRVAAKVLSDGQVAEIRAKSPMQYRLNPSGLDELHDVSGAVVARVDYSSSELVRGQHAVPTSIQVLDNVLDGAWLLGVLWAGRG